MKRHPHASAAKSAAASATVLADNLRVWHEICASSPTATRARSEESGWTPVPQLRNRQVIYPPDKDDEIIITK